MRLISDPIPNRGFSAAFGAAAARACGAAAAEAADYKIARDAVIWTHLAGDSIQRMKAVRRLKWN